jgi:acyl-coenzyme A thioesterase PaaI-like protein
MAPGRCSIRSTYREGLGQQRGFFHAGVICAIADSACGYAAYTIAPPDSEVLTAEFKINLLAPASGEKGSRESL